MIVEMAVDFSVDGTNIYDLGCSTGTTLLNLGQNIQSNVKFIELRFFPGDACKVQAKTHRTPFSQGIRAYLR